MAYLVEPCISENNLSTVLVLPSLPKAISVRINSLAGFLISMQYKVRGFDYSMKERKASGPWNGGQDLKLGKGSG